MSNEVKSPARVLNLTVSSQSFNVDPPLEYFDKQSQAAFDDYMFSKEPVPQRINTVLPQVREKLGLNEGSTRRDCAQVVIVSSRMPGRGIVVQSN